MSTIPVFETVNVANGSFPSVQIAPMEQTVVNGYFTQASSSDVLKVNLQAGEIFTATLDVQYPVINTDWGSSLEIYDPHGNVVASQSTDILYGQNATDPTSGNLTDNNSVAFVAPISGTYPIVVAENAFLADAYFGPATYILTLRPVTLDTSTLAPDVNAQDAAKLQYTGGGLYAYLDANEDTLTFSGPTGRGFQISGQFSEVTTPVSGSSLTISTITGTGTLTLQSGLGAIPLPLPPGLELVVTTDANGYDGLFGEVASAQIQFPYESLVTDLVDPLGGATGSYLDQANSAPWATGSCHQCSACQPGDRPGRTGQLDYPRRTRQRGRALSLLSAQALGLPPRLARFRSASPATPAASSSIRPTRRCMLTLWVFLRSTKFPSPSRNMGIFRLRPR